MGSAKVHELSHTVPKIEQSEKIKIEPEIIIGDSFEEQDITLKQDRE